MSQIGKDLMLDNILTYLKGCSAVSYIYNMELREVHFQATGTIYSSKERGEQSFITIVWVIVKRELL